MLTRQDFLRLTALAGVGALAASLGACGGDEEDVAAGDCSATISANHGHTLAVERADIDAAADKTYDIQGSGDHSHTVTITAAEFATLAAGGSATVVSTSAGGHTHDVVLSDCA